MANKVETQRYIDGEVKKRVALAVEEREAERNVNNSDKDKPSILINEDM